MAMKKKGYRRGGKVKKMMKGGAAGGRVRRMSKGGKAGGIALKPAKGRNMTLAQVRAAAKKLGYKVTRA